MGRGFFGPASCPGEEPASQAGRDGAPWQCSPGIGCPGCRAKPAWPAAAGVEEEGAAPCRAQVSSPGAEFGDPAAELPRRTADGRRAADRGDEAEPGSQARRAASMFSRNHRSRVTVARGSALEMEFKRGRFRLSLFSDPPEVRARVLASPRPGTPAAPAARPPPARTRGAGSPRAASTPRLLTGKVRRGPAARYWDECHPRHSLTVGTVCLCPDEPQLVSF